MGRLQTIIRARSTRIVLASGLIALGVMGFAPYVFNDVSTEAAINAPLIRLTAAADGTVANLPANGQYFAKPTEIRLLDLSQDTGEVADLKAQADLARARMDLAKRQLAELSVQETRLKHRASIFQSATTARLTQNRAAAQATLQGCEANRTQLAATLARVHKLAAQGFVSASGVEKAQADVTLKASDCASAQAQIRAIQIAREAASSGVFVGDSYNDAPYAVQQADRIMLQRQGIEKTLDDASAQYTQTNLRLKDALARSRYRAPAGTLVWDRTSSSGAAIRAGQPVLDLVDCRRRFLEVALPERKAEVIVPGAPVDIRLIGSDQWTKGHVLNITGAAGRRSDELMAASTKALPSARAIVVDVALPTPPLDKFDASRKCDVGRLAEVRFSRNL